MTETQATETPGAPASPPPVALHTALALVTKYHLRLTFAADSRLGSLGPDYVLGAANWTGKKSTFVGFFSPAGVGPAADVERRLTEAAAWGLDRCTTQPAERCDILLIALTPVPEGIQAPEADPRVHVSLAIIDPETGDVTQPISGAAGVPSARELKTYAKAAKDEMPAPTLAAVDLAEREAVRGGYVAPARAALRSTPVVTYTLIGMWVAIWMIEHALVRTGATVSGGTFITSAVTSNDFGTMFSGPGVTPDWWRFVAASFLHLFDTPWHLALNSMFMYFVGRSIEQLYGRLAMLGAWLTCAIGSSLAVWILGLSETAFGGAVGASGGNLGLLAMMFTMGRYEGRNVPAGLVAGLRNAVMPTALINVAFTVVGGYGGGLYGVHVSWEGHLGGALTGLLVGLILPPLRAIGGRDLRPYEKAIIYAIIAFAAASLLYAGYNVIHEATGPAPIFTPADFEP